MVSEKESKRTSLRRRKSTRRSSKRRVGRRVDGIKLKRKSDPVRVAAKTAKKGWKKVSPYLTSAWVFVGLVFSFMLSWVIQKGIKLVDKAKQKRERMNKKTRVLTNGTLFHSLISWLVFEANPFWRRKVIYETPLEELPDNLIIMANHISFADPFVVSGAIPECKAAAQSGLFDIPIVGEVFTNNGDMPVYFEKKPSGKWGTREGALEELMNQSEQYLEDGVPVACFPEGTISQTGELLPFRKGYFHLAVKTNSPILPLAMWGNQKAWPIAEKINGFSKPSYVVYPTEIYLKVGSPIYPEGRDVEELMQVVRSKMEEMLHELPNFKPGAPDSDDDDDDEEEELEQQQEQQTIEEELPESISA